MLEPCPDIRASIEELIGGEQESVIARPAYRGTDSGGLGDR